jgi:hypothetical protein
MALSGMFPHVVWQRLIGVYEVLAAFIIIVLMMNHNTRRNILNDSHFHYRHRENLKFRLNVKC